MGFWGLGAIHICFELMDCALSPVAVHLAGVGAMHKHMFMKVAMDICMHIFMNMHNSMGLRMDIWCVRNRDIEPDRYRHAKNWRSRT